MFRATSMFRFSQQLSRPSFNSAGVAAAAEAAQQQASKMATKKKPDSTFTMFRNVGFSLGAGLLLVPHVWIQTFQLTTSFKEDEERNHGQANKWQEAVRGARRQSLKEYKEAYYGSNEKLEQPAYTPGAYWDRFNNNTIVEQKHNPNVDATVPKMKRKRSVGIYDTVGAVDNSRTRDGNEYRRKRSQSYMKEEDKPAVAV